MLHCPQHTGYAIGTLEKVFADAAVVAGYDPDRIFYSYPKVVETTNPRVIECRYDDTRARYQRLEELVRRNQIRQVIAFDLGFPSQVIPFLRHAGVSQVISYWGASMSSVNSGVKLALKRLEWAIRRRKPDVFVFESEAMRRTATHGRGVPHARTRVVYLGVDTRKYRPASAGDWYVHDTLGIPRERKVVFYSGHIEERKGIRVLMQAAVHLVEILQERRFHLVLCGNKGAEAEPFRQLVAGSATADHVTFAGYRTDVPELMRSSYIGVIASTGWDSFTMSSVEMMASGLPLIVSRLQGLAETARDGENGFHVEPGNPVELAERIRELIDQPEQAAVFSRKSRQLAESKYSREAQVASIAELLRGTGQFGHRPPP